MATRKKKAAATESMSAVQTAIVNRDPGALRKVLGKNQTEFWKRIHVTQSGGSRYESGRKMSVSVQQLFIIAYGTDEEAREVFEGLRPKVAA